MICKQSARAFATQLADASARLRRQITHDVAINCHLVRQPTSPEDLSCAILGQEEMIIQIQNSKTGIQMQRPAVKLETDLKICKSPTFGATYIGIFEPRSGMEITNIHLPQIFVASARAHRRAERERARAHAINAGPHGLPHRAT